MEEGGSRAISSRVRVPPLFRRTFSDSLRDASHVLDRPVLIDGSVSDRSQSPFCCHATFLGGVCSCVVGKGNLREVEPRQSPPRFTVNFCTFLVNLRSCEQIHSTHERTRLWGCSQGARGFETKPRIVPCCVLIQDSFCMSEPRSVGSRLTSIGFTRTLY